MIDLNRYISKNRDAQKGKTVFAGSSLMEEFPLEELFFEKGKIVYNRGISGATAKEYLEIFDQLILPLEPDHLLINIGSNDLSDEYYEHSHLLDSYLRIFRTLKSCFPLCTVTFIRFYPVNTEIMKEFSRNHNEEWLLNASKYRTNNRLFEANEKIINLANLYGYQSIDVNDLLMDRERQLDASYTKDGIHLTEAAYIQIFPMIYQFVDSLEEK